MNPSPSIGFFYRESLEPLVQNRIFPRSDSGRSTMAKFVLWWRPLVSFELGGRTPERLEELSFLKYTQTVVNGGMDDVVGLKHYYRETKLFLAPALPPQSAESRQVANMTRVNWSLPSFFAHDSRDRRLHLPSAIRSSARW